MPDLILLGLLMAAIAIGFWLGRRDRRPDEQAPAPATLSRDYFVGLNHLLNEQPDRAIETFVQALEVNSDLLWKTIQNTLKSRMRTWLEICAHCGLCAERCPTGAIVWLDDRQGALKGRDARRVESSSKARKSA